MGAKPKVVPLPIPEADGLRGMPDRWTPGELEKLLRQGAKYGFTLEEVDYGCQQVRIWWETRRQKRQRWVQVVIGAMRRGWALRGFKAEQERRGRRRATRITEDVIAREIARYRQGG